MNRQWKYDIIIDAVKNIFEDINVYSCSAIDKMAVSYSTRETPLTRGRINLRILYEKIFKPENINSHHYWLHGQFETKKEAKQWRLTALCLFAAMIGAGDDKKLLTVIDK